MYIMLVFDKGEKEKSVESFLLLFIVKLSSRVHYYLHI